MLEQDFEETTSYFTESREKIESQMLNWLSYLGSPLTRTVLVTWK